MATALDLLMSTKEDVNLFSEESDICTIDAKTRAIFVPSTIVVGGVQSDKNAERIKFSCPKIVGDNLDLSKFSVRINFENVSSVDFNVSIKDQYICDDVAVDGENVTFSWLIGRNAARYMGTVRFIVCAVKTDSDSNISVEWNTAIAEVPVLEGIEIDQPQIGQEEKDVINQLLELTKNTSAEAVQNVNSAKEQAIKDIQSVSQPDTTLTIEGGLAEAKATGEAIGSLKEDIGDFSTKSLIPYTKIENKMIDRYNARYDNSNYDLIVVQDLSQYIGMQILFTFSAADSAAYTISTNEYEKILEHGTPEEIISDYKNGTYISTTVKVNVTEQMKILQISFAKNKNSGFLLAVWNSVRGEIQKIGQFETPEMYGAKGDGVTDDSGAFQRMLDHCEKPILLGAKEYKISTGLIDTTGHVFLPNSSTLNCDFPGYAYTVNIKKTRDAARLSKYNLNINGNFLSDGIHIVSSIGNDFNVRVKNVPNVGLHLDRSKQTAAYENKLNVHVDNIGKCGEIGVDIDGNDNFVYSAIVINCKIAIRNNGNTQYTYIHGWLDRFAKEYWSESVLFLDRTNTNGANITYLYADTYRYGLKTENYAFIMVHTYYALINTNEIPISDVIENKHITFSGNGSSVINTFETYHDASLVLIVESSTVKPRVRVNNVKGIDFIKTCSISQIVFPCEISNEYESFSFMPKEIQDSYTDSVIGISPISFGGTNGLICRYYKSNKIFFIFNTAITKDTWSYIPIS